MKVVLLSYSRSGSSLLGELLALPASSSYYYEPLWQHNLSCRDQLNNTNIAPRLDNIIGRLPHSSYQIKIFLAPALFI